MEKNIEETKSKRPVVSVIVPLYNPGEGFLRRCLKTLQAQTLQDIEILFVDDNSAEDPAVLLGEDARKDARVRILRQEKRGGAGPTRNAGICAARGEYLTFFDQDDQADESLLEELVTVARQKDFDIVKGNFCYEQPGERAPLRSKVNDTIRQGLANGAPLWLVFYDQHQGTIYHRRLFADPQVRYGLRGSEDITFLLHVCRKAQSFATLPMNAATYYYGRSPLPESIANSPDPAVFLTRRIEGFQEQLAVLMPEAEDESAQEYVRLRLLRLLTYQRHTAEVLGYREIAEAALKELRSLALAFPAIDAIRERDVIVRALTDYGENISLTPYTPIWEKPDREAKRRCLHRYLAFAKAHPELYDMATAYLLWMRRKSREETERNAKGI